MANEPYMLAGVMAGLEKASANLLNIRMAKIKLDKDNENHTKDLKIKQLQIDRAEEDLDPSRLAYEREKLSLETKNSRAAYNINQMKVKEAERTEAQNVQAHKQTLDFLQKMQEDPTYQLPEGVKLDVGNLSMTGPKAATFSDTMRADVSTAATRIQNGEDSKKVIGELTRKYPKDLKFDTLQNLRRIGTQATADNEQYRDRAIKALKDSGYSDREITDAHIREATRQIKAYEKAR